MDTNAYHNQNDNNPPNRPDELATTSFSISANTTLGAEQTKLPNRYEKLKIILIFFVGFITITVNIVVLTIMVSTQHGQLNEAQQNNMEEVIQALKNQTFHFQAIENKIVAVKKQTNELAETQQNDIKEVIQALKNQTSRFKAIENKLSAVAKSSNQSDKILSQDCCASAKMDVCTNDVYNVTVGNQTTEAYCDMETDGGGWTVIQRRTSRAVDFYRDWQSYVDGFGNIPSNFWLGLENIHKITSSGCYKLRVDLEDFAGNRAYALYSSFKVGDKSTNYQLYIEGYNGTAGDALATHNYQPFSTKDRNHVKSGFNCAVRYHGAWWYESCHDSNLNGRYLCGGVVNSQGIDWYYWKNSHESLKRAEMKIKPN